MSVTHVSSNLPSFLTPDTSAPKQVATVIKFSTTRCGPCKVIMPAYEKLAAQYTNMRMLTVDIDTYGTENEGTVLGEKYKVNGVPTFVVLHEGAEVARLVGADADKLKKLLKQVDEHYKQP